MNILPCGVVRMTVVFNSDCKDDADVDYDTHGADDDAVDYADDDEASYANVDDGVAVNDNDCDQVVDHDHAS